MMTMLGAMQDPFLPLPDLSPAPAIEVLMHENEDGNQRIDWKAMNAAYSPEQIKQLFVSPGPAADLVNKLQRACYEKDAEIRSLKSTNSLYYQSIKQQEAEIKMMEAECRAMEKALPDHRIALKPEAYGALQAKVNPNMDPISYAINKAQQTVSNKELLQGTVAADAISPRTAPHLNMPFGRGQLLGGRQPGKSTAMRQAETVMEIQRQMSFLDQQATPEKVTQEKIKADWSEVTAYYDSLKTEPDRKKLENQFKSGVLYGFSNPDMLKSMDLAKIDSDPKPTIYAIERDKCKWSDA